jgi:hypothetical protein
VYDCVAQEKEQMEKFKKTLLPKLIRMANSQCRYVRYCIIYYCDGQPTVAVMMIIPPTVRCRNIKNIEAEMNRYEFN